MTRHGTRTVLVGVVAAAVVGCGGSGAAATLVNDTGMSTLAVERINADGSFDGSGVFTQRHSLRTFGGPGSCLTVEDGGFAIKGPTGGLVAEHGYRTRQVCDGDVVRIGPGGTLTWE